MAKYFLTSGTGYLGAAVARAAQQAGHEVTALARSEKSAARLQEQGVTPHRGDLKQPETYRDVLKQYDVVVHLAASDGPDYRELDERTVDTIAEALRGTDKGFVYTSGVWVLGNTGSKPATEETPTNPVPLVAWRPAVEQRVLDAAKNGVRSVVVRPGLVYGRGAGILGTLVANAKKNGYASYVGDGENRWPLVHVDDAGELYVLAAEKAPAGSLFHATYDDAPKQREVAELAAKAAGVAGKTKSESVTEAKQTWGPYAEPLTTDQQVHSPASKRVLGWQPKQPKLADDLAQNARELTSPRP
jgi:nucleoside-diphosphate-sugar epimerase